MPSVGSAHGDVSNPCLPTLSVRNPNAWIVAVATATIVQASSRPTVPSVGTSAVSAVDGVPSILHVKQRGHLEVGRVPHTRAVPHGDFVRGCRAAMEQATST